VWSAFRESSFGHGLMDFLNDTTAVWNWQRNQDLAASKTSDTVCFYPKLIPDPDPDPDPNPTEQRYGARACCAILSAAGCVLADLVAVVCTLCGGPARGMSTMHARCCVPRATDALQYARFKADT